MEVDLRSVECSVSLIYYIRQSQIIQCTSQCFRSHLPVFVTSHGIFRTGGQFYMIFKSKQLIYFIDQSCYTFDLVTDLLRHHKDMSIVLCEAAYTHQSVQLTGFLMTVNQSKLSHTQRQITVRTRF